MYKVKLCLVVILVTVVDSSFKLDDGNIIIEIARIVFRVDNNRDNVPFHVWIKFRFSVDIPLSQTNS